VEQEAVRMARVVGKLSPMKVQKERRPGMYRDGGGLWLHVGPTGGKSWVFRYIHYYMARSMGLGPLHTVGLTEARERARAARLLLLDSIDPLDAKADQRDREKLEAAKAVTFRACAERYVAAHRAGWRNAKHAGQ
jgi:hypothetical protein